MRYARPLLLGAGAALLPFAVVALFTWARTGRALGAVALFGHGELLAPTAVLAAQALTIAYGAPEPLRTRWRTLDLIVGWVVIVTTPALLTVPYAGTTGFEPRLVALSTGLFAVGVAVRLAAARWETGGER